VSPDALRAQLTRLVQRGWRGATFTDAVLRPPWPRTLAVTFDDAFLSVSTRARPVLDELGLPGTVFVPTGFVGERRYLEWPGIDHWSSTPDSAELECMNWNDLAGLAEAGWEIGSHTCTHPRLTQLDDGMLKAELETSRRECSERLGRSCDSLAYPFGDVDQRVTAAARQAGYLCAGGLSSSLVRLGPHRWPRIGIYHDDASWRFQLKMSAVMRVVRATRFWPAHE
jgi:peptidoglycan/xylan/chitin deacetylase (PgdA/CDA1 family)